MLSYDLKLSSGNTLGELEVDTTASQTTVDLGVGIESVVNTTTLLLIEDDLEDLGSVLLGAQALADNLDWEDEVAKDSVVHSGECARTWALLGLRGARAVGALGAGKDAARGEDQDVAVGELLLELTGEADWDVSWILGYILGGILTAAAHGGNPEGMGRGQR